MISGSSNQHSLPSKKQDFDFVTRYLGKAKKNLIASGDLTGGKQRAFEWGVLEYKLTRLRNVRLEEAFLSKM